MVTTLLKGTKVVDACSGAQLGRVHAVYLDPVQRRVVGFALRRGRFFWRRRPGLLMLDTVRRLGPDGVEVVARTTYGGPARDPEGAGLIALDDLVRRPVLLEDGTALGRIVAVRFDQDSRRLASLEVEPDGLPPCRMLLDADQIVRVGPTAVLVREHAVASLAMPTPPAPMVPREYGHRRVA